ncbi:MAG: glycine--tRNA ligase [Candidatus Marinimicrobia bacterium]|nr:glycine--tRNA ligase [Candidatus Neomarinimicrobiota bacterium]
MNNKMEKVISLAKQRGYVFQSSEIYGSLKSAYDYGPLGVELKRNLMNEWWRSMVHEREDVIGIDASIIMHPKVWNASGHLSGFSDPLVDCLISKERFRADKAPTPTSGDELPIICNDKGQAKQYQKSIEKRFGIEIRRNGKVLEGLRVIDDSTFGYFEKDSDDANQTFPYRGYVSPTFGSPFLSDERQFNLMFRSQLGPVDSIGDLTSFIEKNPDLKGKELRKGIEKVIKDTAVYLRPETAQAMFVQFLNCQQSMSMKVPFGIAQMGKSFRNEITTEHFIFRSCEFEQMEMEFFVEPGTQKKWLDYWRDKRLNWWKSFANNPDKFIYRAHDKDELAHYADACYDIEYEYPWGFDELEGVASRTDYDLKKHAEHSGAKLSYFDPQKQDPQTGKNGWRYTPFVIEPAAGATRGLLVYLLDAYHEETVQDAKGNDSIRKVMKIHPKLAPIKTAILPLVKKEGLPEIARDIVSNFFKAGINTKYDEQHAIGKRYRRHDEAGTPFCLTIDGQTKEDGTITIRDRDTMKQDRIPAEKALEVVKTRLGVV